MQGVQIAVSPPRNVFYPINPATNRFSPMEQYTLYRDGLFLSKLKIAIFRWVLIMTVTKLSAGLFQVVMVGLKMLK